MLLKIYRVLSKKGIGRFIPEKIMFKVQDLCLKTSKDTIKIKVGKYKMNVFKDSNFDFIFKNIYHEPGLTKLLPSISKNVDLFVDVGSCWGYYILLSNAKRNIAIEPEEKNYNLLLRNIEENKIENVSTFKIGIADKTEERVFYKTKKYGTHSLRKDCIKEEDNYASEEIVHVTTLDELLKPFYNQKMLFKIDVEGLEAEVFKGMKELIATNNIEIVFEYNIFRYTKEDFEKINEVVKYFDNIILIDEVKGSWKEITFKEFLEIKGEWRNIYLKMKEKITI